MVILLFVYLLRIPALHLDVICFKKYAPSFGRSESQWHKIYVVNKHNLWIGRVYVLVVYNFQKNIHLLYGTFST